METPGSWCSSRNPPRRRDQQWPVNTCASLLSGGSARGGCSHPEPIPRSRPGATTHPSRAFLSSLPLA
ncbi:unnamed protein product, partial [Rangifer tarandus platyrhynchus]